MRSRITFAATLTLLLCNAASHSAQTSPLPLSVESQRYTRQDPGAVLQTLRSRIAQKIVSPVSVASCSAIPATGLSGLTNDHYYFLSEIGGCPALPCFLKQVPATLHDYSTLIVDQACSGTNAITETLVVPNRFTLAGVGIDGAGVLEFDVPDNEPAIRFTDAGGVANRMATIRDLNLAGNCCGQIGIDVSNSQFVYVRNVRVQNFAFGLFGDHAYSIFVNDSSLHNNAFNIVMGDDTTTWRVRDSVASQGLMGVHIGATARAHLLSGLRIESNWGPGVRIDGAMNVVENSQFEGNGGFADTNYGIWVTSQAMKTRILANVFSSQVIANAGVETHSCFNASFAPNSADVNQC
jgi:hypothetical protein